MGMTLDVGNLITVGLFLLGLWMTHWRTTTKIETDGRVLRAQMENMQAKLTELGSVLVSLADVKGEMKLMNERSLFQGQRLDKLQDRVNLRLDRADPA